MAYQRNINVQGTETIETKQVEISFTYTAEVPPTAVNFSMNSEGVSLFGNCSKEGITNYNVNGGIVTDEFLDLVKTKCVTALTNYETI